MKCSQHDLSSQSPAVVTSEHGVWADCSNCCGMSCGMSCCLPSVVNLRQGVFRSCSLAARACLLCMVSFRSAARFEPRSILPLVPPGARAASVGWSLGAYVWLCALESMHSCCLYMCLEDSHFMVFWRHLIYGSLPHIFSKSFVPSLVLSCKCTSLY